MGLFKGTLFCSPYCVIIVVLNGIHLNDRCELGDKNPTLSALGLENSEAYST